MIVFETRPAVSAFFGVDDIGFVALADSAGGAFERAAAALDAVFCYFVSHDLPLILFLYYTISGNILERISGEYDVDMNWYAD